MWTFAFIILFSHGLGEGFYLPEFPFGEKCGTILKENVGMLYLTAEHLRLTHLNDKQCSVTIKLIPSRSDSQIIFYFEAFDLAGSCDDAKLTISQPLGYYGQTTTNIQGMTHYICGSNSTLLRTGLNFTTYSIEFTITYTFSNYGLPPPGYFSIKFFEFHKGDCDSEQEHKCMYTGNCVSKDYHCSSEIQACPREDMSCDQLNDDADNDDDYDDDASAYAIIWQIAVAIFLLSAVFCLIRYVGPGCKDCLSNICKRTPREPRFQPRTIPRQTVIESTPTESVPTSPRTQGQSSLNTSHIDLSVDAFDDKPPSYEELNNQLSVLYTPPPSRHGDVAATTYEDVVSDTAKYHTSLL